jgi:PAP2 superfamily protein
MLSLRTDSLTPGTARLRIATFLPKTARMSPLNLKQRLLLLSLLLSLYLLAVVLGAVSLPGYRNATGLRDIGHYYVPSLVALFGEQRAEYILWLGTLPLELFFMAIALYILFTGRGARLGLCLYVLYALHWLFLHATTLPPPDHIVWNFPKGVFTFGKPNASDFWFSGHVANALVIALATRESPRPLKILAWSLFVFEALLVLSARTHYTIDVLGGMFVAYSVHRLSLDVERRLSSRAVNAELT